IHPIAMKDADKDDAIIVAVTRNGDTFLSPGNLRMSLGDLPGKVTDLLTNRLDKTVYIRADARAKYQAVEDTVDALRAAGVHQLGLLTERPQGSIDHPTPPPKASRGTGEIMAQVR